VKRQKKKLKIVYDIIPPRLAKDIILVEKKVSKIAKASYLFLKTSKYGSIVFVLGIAILGGTLIMGFSPKTETMEIYPAQYKGDWQNMEKALDRKFSDKADISEFNSSNSANVVNFKEEINKSEIESEEAQDENISEEEIIEEIKTEEPTDEISFFKKTKSLFSAFEAKAEESAGDESRVESAEVAGDIIPTEDLPIADDDEIVESDPVISNDSDIENLEEEIIIKDAEAGIIDEKNKDNNADDGSEILDEENKSEEEKFEDYSGIILPNIDGDSFSEIQDKAAEKNPTIFTKELSAIYSGFSIPQGKGELQKIKIGFSFASMGKENEDDEIIVFWSLNGESWNSASEFVLNKTYSNKDNGGYFYADIFNSSDYSSGAILNWEDIQNIKVKFSYLTNNSEEDYVSFFLDAVWLEVEVVNNKENLEKGGNDRIKFLSDKKDFKRNEEPEFKFKYQKKKASFLASIGETIGIIDYWSGINITAEITTPQGETIKIPRGKFNEFFENFDFAKNGEFSTKLKKTDRFKPGLYKIALKIEDGGEKNEFQQDFTWGVLTINTNKSIYVDSKSQITNPNDQISNSENGEIAYIQMGVLNNNGKTVCDAMLKLQITNPKSQIPNPKSQIF
jgi:hypothetical protein